MDRGGKTISGGSLHDLSQGKTCPHARADREGHPEQNERVETIQETTLQEAEESSSDLRVGKARKYHRWKVSDIQFITENMDKMTNVELAKALGLPTHKVSSYMGYLGLKRSVFLYSPRKDCAKNPNYKPHEDQYIIEHYMSFTAEFIGRKLGRSEKAIAQRANRLGIKKNFRWL